MEAKVIGRGFFPGRRNSRYSQNQRKFNDLVYIDDLIAYFSKYNHTLYEKDDKFYSAGNLIRLPPAPGRE